VAHRIGVIDHGKLVAQGTPKEIKEQTGTETLEDAFLALTGSSIRSEGADPAAQMRQFAQMWQQNRR
jgi:ABC-2 type transport system ATP-binding protein